MAKPYPTEQAPHYISARMVKLGFVRCKTSKSGSRYLSYPGSPFRLRLSDHQWSGYSKSRYPDVVKNFVPKMVVSADNVDDIALHVGIGFIAMTRRRMGILGALPAESQAIHSIS